MNKLITTIAIFLTIGINAQTTIGKTENFELTESRHGSYFLSFRDANYQILNESDRVIIEDIDKLYNIISKGISERVKGRLEYPTQTRGESLTISFNGKKVSLHLTHESGVSSYSYSLGQRQLNKVFNKQSK